jgi:carboxylesterase
VEHAVVLVHGLSSCPRQFAQLAALLHERGCNVLVPRMPHNGSVQRDGAELRHLTAEKLCRFTDDIVDVARGLGERVVVAGLSGGGVAAGWAAQFRTDVDRAVLIAPGFGITPTLPALNMPANRLFLAFLRVLPNVMKQKVRPYNEGPQHAYGAFATKGLAAMMAQGLAVLRAARGHRPGAKAIQVVLNESDNAVNNAVTRELVRRWRRRGAPRVDVFSFGREHRLIHDIIDPEQTRQQTALVYPVLVRLLLDEA